MWEFVLVLQVSLSIPGYTILSWEWCARCTLVHFNGNVADKVIVALKVASYALTNRDLRDMYLESVPTPTEYESAPYPENINLSNLLYFWWAPTLIYQPVYPHTANFRLGFFLKRSGEAVGILIALWFIIAQYAMFHSQIIKFNQLDPSSITRSLRLTNSISPKSSNEY